MDIGTLAKRTKVDDAVVRGWLDGSDMPTKTQWGKLAAALRRSRSTFLLPDPPPPSVPPELRVAAGYSAHELEGDEALQVRRARRVQRYLDRIMASASTPRVPVPTATTSDDPRTVGSALREWLQVSADTQLNWPSASQALAGWRSAFEARGIITLQMQLGTQGVRGFALPGDAAPIVAFNSAETNQARCFTLLHELSHLALGAATSCALPVLAGDEWPVERWCDETAAEILMPRAVVATAVRDVRASRRPPSDDIALVRRVATRMKSSLRATAVRLEALNIVPRGTFREIDRRYANSDRTKQGGGTGQGGETSPEKRRREFGLLGGSLVLAGLEARVITERDARDLLRLDGPGLRTLDQLLERP